jgi:hypothetical protein
MTISFKRRVSVPADVLVREVGGEAVILNLNSERYFGLDEIGARMLAILATGQTIEAAYETLRAEYEVEPERLRQDLQDLIDELVEHGLLELNGG